ncbi:hypothetical protein [Phytohabitans rumicis]|uniref:YbaB/EbfC DNA-binding family protein n=1 Tax=Phytohabitans rumicis TaxID=1076125 RepID=A0A6V8L2T6_9ACTN|nr:hypothetical protein [Phytohabitans rumicis]GFJ89081.1 hypothetical protein Prum_027230 [Phytohabitans rumicis]
MDELRRDAAALAARVAGSLAGAAHSGHDASGAVRIDLDRAGRVTAVHVAASWRTALPADRLGAAVVEAFSDAATRRLAAWAEAATAPTPRAAWAEAATAPRATRAEAATAPTPPPAGALPAVSGPAGLAHPGELLALLDEVAAFVAAPPTQEAIGRSAHATVTVRSGDVVAVDVDPRWLARAECAEVAAELLRALNTAYRMLAELAAGADGLLRRLGLDPPADNGQSQEQR